VGWLYRSIFCAWGAWKSGKRIVFVAMQLVLFRNRFATGVAPLFLVVSLGRQWNGFRDN